MRAIVYSEPGGSQVLRLVERPEPVPAPGEVRVRVHLSGVNPTDWKARRGGRGSGGLEFAEVVPNQDGAGVVDAVGDGVSPDRVGERVWLWEAAWQRAGGTAQELVALPAHQAVRLPDEASFELGASLGIPALTAHRCLTVGGPGRTELYPGALAGTTVLVAGGAGAVGHAAIQLARWAGAMVVATVSSAVNAPLDAAVLAPGGTVAVYATDGGGELPLEVWRLMQRNIGYRFVLVYTVPAEAKERAVADVSAAVADGALPVGDEAGLPLHRFPLERTAEAHDAVEAGAVGKVLIELDG